MTDFNVCRLWRARIPSRLHTPDSMCSSCVAANTTTGHSPKARPSKNELEVINKRPNFGRSMFFLCYSFSTSHFLIQFLFELYMFVAFHLSHIWLPSASFSVVIFVKSTSLTTISVLSSWNGDQGIDKSQSSVLWTREEKFLRI